ncbi:molybdopterin molybdotransferase MoeA [Psychrobacter sp. AOP22-C1-22]|uniref:molybdopterin molybdotransferase MoeA n=1 Tax=unclassified Psychrobacter TaxID=196806 RepID=UPI00178899EA|nr:gephyrin-like molybdotransferase Glp [Psychrobacter sp. FME6]MBE0406105.1 molybdopterin molybdotransferase MoeA [Psychrobacter sp. FME6]
MITVEALKSAIKQRIAAYHHNDYPLHNRQIDSYDLLASRNQILAKDIISPFAIPRQNLSAMDGYAIARSSVLSADSTITIIGESQAGSAYTGDIKSGQGIRVFTGAIVPDGCDTVIMQENTNFAAIKDTLDKSQPYSISLSQTAKCDNNIRKKGEEIEAGEVVLRQGKRLNPTDISLLANLGFDRVDVYQPLIVGLLATGDELVAIGHTLDSVAQIYNSNTPTLKTLLADLPIDIRDYGIIADDLDKTTAAVTEAMQACDVVISTAGVSVGDYDFLTTAIDQLGKINHYKVAMKPGKPFVFGELTQNLTKPVLYFGLPGNPLSTVVGTLQFVLPALWQMTGAATQEQPVSLTITATLTNEVKKSAGRTDFQRGVLSQDKSGGFYVESFNKQQSHRIKQLSQANCLMVLAQDTSSLSAGDKVHVQPFPWFYH